MASPTTHPRPRPVALAGWLIIVGAVLTIVNVWDQIGSIGSLKMAETIEQLFDTSLVEDFDLSVGQVEGLIRGMGMVAAVCSSTMAILAWQVLRQRSLTARLWLSLLVAPFFLTALVSGGFVPMLVALGVAFLWSQPAREWFAGTWKPVDPTKKAIEAERREPRNSDNTRALTTPVKAGASAGSTGGREVAGWPAADSAATAGAEPVRVRPASVVAACVVTWLFSAMAATLMALSAIMVLADPQFLIDEFNKTDPELLAASGLTTPKLQAFTIVCLIVTCAWSATACLFALSAFRGASWGRTALVICAGAVATLMLLCSFAAPVCLLPFAAATATVVLLTRADSKAWASQPRNRAK